MARERDSLVIGRIIGDVVDRFQRSVPFRVLYGGRELTNGFYLKPSDVVKSPTVVIGSNNSRPHHYTLVMVDPDAPNPSDPTQKEYLHWLVINIPAGSSVSMGQEQKSYERPKPAVGIHRIVFILFQQPSGGLNIDVPGWREHFNTKDFAAIYNLGLPVAAVYFNCQKERPSKTLHNR